MHEVVPAAELEAEAEKVLEALLQGAPGAQAAAKDLVFLCEGRVVDEALSAETGRRIAELMILRPELPRITAPVEGSTSCPPWMARVAGFQLLCCLAMMFVCRFVGDTRQATRRRR